MDLSIVTTLYCSENCVQEFYQRISEVARQITSDYELIFVDDGSPDNSLTLVLSICAQDTKVRVIELSRNFGHHRAIMTGLEHARGDLVFLLDSDLEETPETLLQFRKEMESTRSDVIYGVQTSRKGDWFERATGSAFYWLFNKLSTYPVPKNLVTARLMTLAYVKALIQHRDREIFLAGLWAITGFRQIGVPVEKGHKGNSTYNLVRRLALLVNAITSFSNRPLILVFYLGSGVLLVSGTAGVALIVRVIFWGAFLPGWASLMVSLWFLGGLMIFCIGIVGIYLSRVYSETKDRPYTIIRKLHGHIEKMCESDGGGATCAAMERQKE
jgi:putative glycosyltransferase